MKNKTPRQLNLFLDEESNSDPVYDAIHVNKSTFKGGLDKSIHNWFRLTPSFGPKLVDHMLEVMGFQDGQVVLDPFAGASTTLIQCKKRKIESFGFEINPLLHFVGQTSLNWDLNIEELFQLKIFIKENYNDRIEQFLATPLEELEIPKIHNPFRWWREDVLRKMLCIKDIIREIKKKQYKDFALLALAGVLVPDLTNVTLSRLQLHFIIRDNDTIKVLPTYMNKLSQMIDDIKTVEKISNIPSFLFHTNATKLNDEVEQASKADFIITSPPYPNRYSYVWNTRPHLYLFEFFNTPKEAAELDKKAIGGTWGSATSCLQKGIIEPINNAVKVSCSNVIDDIRKKDNLMANYVIKYFNLLTDQILEAEKVLSDNCKLAYVVGNSRIKEVYINTDEILQNIFQELDLGYSDVKVQRFRKRHSGKDLYESIVFAYR